MGQPAAAMLCPGWEWLRSLESVGLETVGLETVELETVELHDAPAIRLRVGDQEKDSSALSTGQKCTTVLPILLLEGGNPLLIDLDADLKPVAARYLDEARAQPLPKRA